MHKRIMTREFALTLALWLWASPLCAAVSPLENYRETVNEIINGFNDRDAEPFNQAIDVNAIADKAMDIALADADWKAGVRDGMLPGYAALRI